MAEARIHFTPSEIATLCIATIVACIAAGLTLVVEFGHDEALIPLLYPLFPGILIGLAITGGGHGGTPAQSDVAPYAAAVINAVFYGFIVFLFMIVRRRFASRSK